MGESLYHLLGVDRDADESAIRRAYRERVKEHHPDVSDAPGSVTRFKRLTTARDVLTDETERARYDRLGHDAYVAAELDTDRWDSVEGRDQAVAGTERPDRTTARTTTSRREPAAAAGSSRSGSRAAEPGEASAAYVASVGPRNRYRAPTVETETASTVDRAVTCLTTMGPWLLVHAVFLVTAAAAAGALVVRAGSMPVLSLPLGTAFFGLALCLSALHVVSLVYV